MTKYVIVFIVFVQADKMVSLREKLVCFNSCDMSIHGKAHKSCSYHSWKVALFCLFFIILQWDPFQRGNLPVNAVLQMCQNRTCICIHSSHFEGNLENSAGIYILKKIPLSWSKVKKCNLLSFLPYTSPLGSHLWSAAVVLLKASKVEGSHQSSPQRTLCHREERQFQPPEKEYFFHCKFWTKSFTFSVPEWLRCTLKLS